MGFLKTCIFFLGRFKKTTLVRSSNKDSYHPPKRAASTRMKGYLPLEDKSENVASERLPGPFD